MTSNHPEPPVFESTDWRFNLRSSNTAPLLRLNVESRGDRELMEQKTREILGLLEGQAAARRCVDCQRLSSREEAVTG